MLLPRNNLFSHTLIIKKRNNIIYPCKLNYENSYQYNIIIILFSSIKVYQISVIFFFYDNKYQLYNLLKSCFDLQSINIILKHSNLFAAV